MTQASEPEALASGSCGESPINIWPRPERARPASETVVTSILSLPPKVPPAFRPTWKPVKFATGAGTM